MIERVFRHKNLDRVKTEATAYINDKIEAGWEFLKVHATREGKERVFIVYMRAPKESMAA